MIVHAGRLNQPRSFCLLVHTFYAPSFPSPQYGIDMKRRGYKNTKMDRDKIIQMIAAMVWTGEALSAARPARHAAHVFSLL